MIETPVPQTPVAVPRGSRRRLAVAGAVIVAALGFLLYRGLGDATLYFKTADEAVAQRATLGDRPFRIEGVVVAGSVRPEREGVGFRIEHGGVQVGVLHRGDPPELFQDDIPVVLQGRFRGERFDSDTIMVKHTEQYRAENPDRVEDYPRQRGGVPRQQGTKVPRKSDR